MTLYNGVRSISTNSAEFGWINRSVEVTAVEILFCA
jgi:hypothetical protein